MSGLLTDRRILAVGIGNDLGAHICLQLTLEGCHVIGIADDREFLEQIEHEIRDVNGRFDYIADAADGWTMMLQSIDLLMDRHGPIDSLIFLEPDEVLWQNEQPVNANESLLYEERLLPLLSGAILVRLITKQQQTMTIADLPQSGAVTTSASIAPVIAPAPVADTLIGLLSEERTIESTKQYDIVVRPDQKQLEVLAHRPDGQSSKIIGSKLLSEYDIAFGTNVYIQHTDRGRGLFAARDFHKDELVMRTSGRVIDFQTEHSIQIGWDLHVEPDPPVRLINHSCQPNLGVKTNPAGLPDFVALREIYQGEEVTFDYAMTEYKHYDRKDPSLEFSLACRCGNDRCRHRLGYYSELTDQLRQEYAGYVSDYLAEIDNS